MWLKDFLPGQIPDARILLFGYNANMVFGSSTAGIDEHAENLLNRLHMKWRTAVKRPIIFICHSLGGIVVKKALTIAKLDKTYRPIKTATYGIAFFGTPHQGGNFATLGDIVASIVGSTIRSPKNSSMEALEKDSLFGDGIIKEFRHQLEDYIVLSFVETIPYKGVGIIVDQKSATLGLSGKRETIVSLDADHGGICRFESIDDDDYEQVSDNIIDLAKKVIDASESTNLV